MDKQKQGQTKNKWTNKIQMDKQKTNGQTKNKWTNKKQVDKQNTNQKTNGQMDIQNYIFPFLENFCYHNDMVFTFQ